MSFEQYWEQLFSQVDQLNELISAYWHDYSHMGTWQFWLTVALLVVPIIILCFTVDKTRIFEIFFFGYTVHMLWTYVNLPLERYGLFAHTYFLTPILPFAINMTASVLPVLFLLTYQYCTNHEKNYYVYAIVLSAIMAFGFASIEEWLGLVVFREGMNKFYLFLICAAISLISYAFTRLLRRLTDKANRSLS
ncbi:MAG: hypothetical protein LRY73_01055 [Bacillus sp. (in: Bacteria)]|nr:hypothetical protein [Bacillus sp. (in: firmicutes)]